jgi:hypothetical protein
VMSELQQRVEQPTVVAPNALPRRSGG